jgi:hypothetical protein
MAPTLSRIRPWLYLSNYQDTLDRPLLDHLGITALLTLAFPANQAGLASLHRPIRDGDPISPTVLAEGLAFVQAQRAAQGTIVIACAAGISRSATFCIGALAEAEGLSLPEAWRATKEQRPQIWPHETLWQSLCTHFDQLVPYSQMLDWLDYPTLVNSDRPVPPPQFGELNL